MFAWKKWISPVVGSAALLAMFMLADEKAQGEQVFALRVSVEKEVYKAGETITLFVSRCNLSRMDVYWVVGNASDAELDTNINIRTDYVGKVPKTDYGKHPERYYRALWRAIYFHVPPGKCTEEYTDLNPIFQFPGPGQYTISATADVPDALGGGKAKSNQVTISIEN